jgi:iron complex transport system permease protein
MPLSSADHVPRNAPVPPFEKVTMRARFAMPIAVLLLVASALTALCAGRYPVSPREVIDTLAAWCHLRTRSDHFSLLHAVVIEARLPRLLAAAAVGAALSAAGAVCQAVFRNPLVSPGMLGVLSGSAFGAAAGIVSGLSAVWIQVSAFAGGIAAVLLGVTIASMLGGASILMLVLGGLVSNAVFSSLLSLVKYVADPLNQLPAIVFWTLGSLAQVGWADLQRLALPLVAGVGVLCGFGRALDVLTLSDDEARSLGIAVKPLRLALIGVATLVSAMTVSLAGMIGWVSLLVPHIARAIVGASNARLLPLSALLGASCLILADTFARSLSAGEIPLGIVTELAGAIAFVVVLRRLRGSVL